MKIFLKTLTGKTETFNVEKTTSVIELKWLYWRRCYLAEGAVEIPESLEKLTRHIIFGTSQLEDHRLLSDYGIEKDSTLHDVLRPKGCGCGCVGKRISQAREES